MKNFKPLCLVLAAAFLFLSELACGQVYSWKDPTSGQTRFSNIAPRWYSRGENVSGPRVIQTLGGKVVDDTSLPYEDRLLLSGKSKDSVERPQPPQATRPPRNLIPAPGKGDAEAARGRPADTADNREVAAGKKNN